VALWFARRSPVLLEIRPAAEHPDVLYRVTYEVPGPAGTPRVRAQGVAAVARGLGHVHLGWALAGWALDLPGVRHFAQLGADAFGAGPRPSRTAACASGVPGGVVRTAVRGSEVRV
jgi:hypothetical protein